MFKKIVLFTFLFLTIALPCPALMKGLAGEPILPTTYNDMIVISSFTHEVAELMEYNGPWLTEIVTILIETNYGDTLDSITEKINKHRHNFFNGTQIEWTMLAEQNPELLFQVVDEHDYLETRIYLLLTANTPIWRLHSKGLGLTSTI